MVLSVAMVEIRFKQRSWNSFRAKRRLGSRYFMCNLLLEGTRFPLQSVPPDSRLADWSGRLRQVISPRPMTGIRISL